VCGYKVKVTRQNLSPEEVAKRRAAVAGVEMNFDSLLIALMSQSKPSQARVRNFLMGLHVNSRRMGLQTINQRENQGGNTRRAGI